jgi:hypothetical protein
VWGVGGGAGAMGFVGGEADYTVANEFFGTKADIGSNRQRMVTGAVHSGYPIKEIRVWRVAIAPPASFRVVRTRAIDWSWTPASCPCTRRA